jgi:hypothetical protein
MERRGPRKQGFRTSSIVAIEADLGEAALTLKEARIWLRDESYRLLGRDAKFRRLVQLGLLVGGPAIAGAGEWASNVYSGPIPKALAAAGWCLGILLVAMGAALFIWIDDNFPEVLLGARRAVDAAEEERNVARQQARQLEQQLLEAGEEGNIVAQAFENLATLYVLGATLREIAEPVLMQGPGDEAAQKSRIGAMLDLLIEKRMAHFAMEDDRWTFAVYLPDADGNLACFESRRPNRLDEKRQHRTWAPGDGHVGKAFQWAQEVVIPDAKDAVVSSLLRGGQSREEDNDRYRSVAAVPIQADGRALGVVVATSDVEERFFVRDEDWLDEIDPVEPLRLLAGTLAIMIAVTKFNESGAES